MLDTLICGDSLEVMKSIPDDRVDLIVTSPPYLKKRSDVYTNVNELGYFDFLTAVSDQAMRILRPTGSLVVNIKEGCEDGARQIYTLEYELYMAKKYQWVDTYIWYKTNPYPTGAKNRLKDSWEHCFHYVKSKRYKFFPNECLVPSKSKWLPGEKKRKNKKGFSVTNGSKLNMSRRCADDLVRPSNVIEMPTSCLNLPHPAVYPPELPAFFIALMTEPGDVVLDPFLGSGSTAIAAQEMKRTYVGIDISPEYIELARTRLL